MKPVTEDKIPLKMGIYTLMDMESEFREINCPLREIH